MSSVAENAAKQSEFSVQQIYFKDLSFESPAAPQIFKQDWQPEMNLELHTQSNKLDQDHHEVVLTVSVPVKSGDKTIFLAEVKVAGIFMVKQFNNEELGPLLGSVCPNILFPYAREKISSMVASGGFPPLYLAPINFDALYQQHLQQGNEQEAQEAAG